MDPHRYSVMGSLAVFGGLQNKVGQLIGGVLAVRCHTTDHPIVPPCHPRPFLALKLTAPHKVILHDLYAKTFQQFQNAIVGDPTFFLVFFIERIHKLVEPAAGCRAAGDHDPDEPERLHGFIKSPGGISWNVMTRFCYSFQLSFA